MQRLLLVDDDVAFLEVLKQRLTPLGFAIDLYPRSFRAQRQEIVIVCLDYESDSAFEIIRSLRKSQGCCSIFACSRRCIPLDVVIALDAGADDFFEKAVDLTILEAKLRQASRRCEACNRMHCGDPTSTLADRLDAQLTRFEHRLLRLLTLRTGEVVSRDLLAQQLWGRSTVESKLLYEHISTLRSKLRFAQWTIVNVRGRGYRLEALSPESDRPRKSSSREN